MFCQSKCSNAAPRGIHLSMKLTEDKLESPHRSITDARHGLVDKRARHVIPTTTRNQKHLAHTSRTKRGGIMCTVQDPEPGMQVQHEGRATKAQRCLYCTGTHADTHSYRNTWNKYLPIAGALARDTHAPAPPCTTTVISLQSASGPHVHTIHTYNTYTPLRFAYRTQPTETQECYWKT